eukprot:TRINITY_DN1773_c0_g1_i3.p1 TRINITY_DN1773_c0_g1~~TRINITY_DN1773_c0_g1_i3.p1  ORF type:complete len:407 (-),score=68.31 TRINITY_DN1773_c0_g1_i3:167-1387(-)
MSPNDGVWSKIKKYRYSIILAGGAGSALLAYFSYKWLNEKQWEQSKESEAGRLGAAWEQTQTTESYQQQADQKLAGHFESVKKVALQVTLPLELLKLKQKIFELADVDKLTKKLRDARQGTITLSSEEKQEVWNQLKVVSFERLVALVWLMPFLQLLVLTQLGVLGRYLYLSSSMQDSWYGETWLGWAWNKVNSFVSPTQKSHDPYSFSQEFQQRYMELFKQLVPALTSEFMKGIKAVCNTQITPWALTDPFDQRLFESVLADVHEVCAQRWDLVLAEWLPTFQIPQGGNGGGGLQESEQKLLKDMWGEVLQIVGSHRFAIVLREMVTWMAENANEEVVNLWPNSAPTVKVGEEESPGLPLAKVVPLLPTVSKNLVQSSPQTYKVLADLENVKDLCAAVYSGQQIQ